MSIKRKRLVDVVHNCTHIKEGACVLQDQLAGVWFVLAVIHIYVELISLEKERRQLYVLIHVQSAYTYWDASSAQWATVCHVATVQV